MFNKILIAVTIATITIYAMEDGLGRQWSHETLKEQFAISFVVALICVHRIMK